MSTHEHSDYIVSSDEEKDFFDEGGSPVNDISYEGVLSKWTNYLHGWQSRYLVLRDGTLSYYKSEYDTAYGSRGSVSVKKAVVEVHEFDSCRFDVNVGDCIYYLRAPDPDERQKWVDVLEASKQVESGYGSESHLPKAVSTLSLVSQPSLHSTSSCVKTIGLREKLLELETYRDILSRQTDTLQEYFDSCAEKNADHIHYPHLDMKEDEEDSSSELANTCNYDNSVSGIDFRGEAITFKATTAGVIQVLSHCIETITKREEYWKRKLEREQEKCHKLIEQLQEYQEEKKRLANKQFIGGPDYMEGPHSKLNEEQFFDAVDSALDAEDLNDDLDANDIEKENIPPPKPTSEIMNMPKHRLSKEVDSKLKEFLTLLKENVEAPNSGWDLVFEDGEMRVYRKDYEVDTIVCDPMKASHVIPGVTGREACHYFFDKDVRLDWEISVEKVKVIEKLSENTLIFHQLMKRIWPSVQRDMCFVSHIRQLPKDEVDHLDKEIGHPWTVVNIATEHDEAKDNKYIRAVANVIMVCQTFAIGEVKKKKYTRENIACKITYMAQVNPGGWAPPTVVRQMSKREYPKFLRKFSSFVQNVTKDKPLML
ncbi:ceramide transfer protein isoform X1 [Hydra vulgaris]|uniref:Ceramide transfer protein n=1 Tax=Hydra vulgaris TaxID=6087 RepID=T2M2R8_HYDVU|nr:ceramide transfer protein [Hydra vulgaris]